MRALRSFFPRLAACLLGALASLPLASACSLVREPGYSGLDAGEYVFYGEIVGYASAPLKCNWNEPKPCNEAWGWRLKVLEMVSAPQQDIKEIELYTFELDAGCSAYGIAREAVQKTSIGTRLKVIGKRWQTPDSDAIRLDVSNYTAAVIVPIPANADVAVLRAEEWNYEDESERDDNHVHAAYDYVKRLHFELRKDLARLETETAPEARVRTLTRLSRAGWFGDRYEERTDIPAIDAFYLALLRKYVVDEAAIKQLIYLRETYMYEYGMFGEKQRAFEIRRADEGSAEYQIYAAMHGHDLVPERRIAWLQSAAKAGWPAADLQLGIVYWELRQNSSPAQAAKYRRLANASFRRASLRGNQMAARHDPWAILMVGDVPGAPAPPIVFRNLSAQAITDMRCLAAKRVSRPYWERFRNLSDCKRPK